MGTLLKDRRVYRKFREEMRMQAKEQYQSGNILTLDADPPVSEDKRDTELERLDAMLDRMADEYGYTEVSSGYKFSGAEVLAVRDFLMKMRPDARLEMLKDGALWELCHRYFYPEDVTP